MQLAFQVTGRLQSQIKGGSKVSVGQRRICQKGGHLSDAFKNVCLQHQSLAVLTHQQHFHFMVGHYLGTRASANSNDMSLTIEALHLHALPTLYLCGYKYIVKIWADWFCDSTCFLHVVIDKSSAQIFKYKKNNLRHNSFPPLLTVATIGSVISTVMVYSITNHCINVTSGASYRGRPEFSAKACWTRWRL